MHKYFHGAAVLTCCLVMTGCASLQHAASNKLGDMLAGGGTSFSGDDDPELIRAAAPFSLKLMETVLQSAPQHTALLTATAGGFTQFAYAFVQQSADEAESQDVNAAFAQRARALALYRRARDYGLRALETRHGGFTAALGRDARAAAGRLVATDAPALYWTAVAWAASISLDKDSPDALADLPRVDALARRLAQLDPDYDHGALDSFLISWVMGLPGAREPAAEAARHFERAVRLSGGHMAGPYVAYAESVCVAGQDRKQFEAQLQRALAVDPDARPEWRLANRVMQRRARWLLGRADDLFIE